jgi:hypothetical protein
MQSLLLLHGNVDPFQTVNHVVYDCPHHDAACSANSHFNFDDQADRSCDYLGCYRMQIGRTRRCAFQKPLEAASGPILVVYASSSHHYFALYRVPAIASQLYPIPIFSTEPEPLYHSHSRGVGYKHSTSLARSD